MGEVENEGAVCEEEVFEVWCGSGLLCFVIKSDGKLVLWSLLLLFLPFCCFGHSDVIPLLGCVCGVEQCE